jgi:hypothetical protein
MGASTRTLTAGKPQLFGRGTQHMALNLFTLPGASTEATRRAQKNEERGGLGGSSQQKGTEGRCCDRCSHHFNHDSAGTLSSAADWRWHLDRQSRSARV